MILACRKCGDFFAGKDGQKCPRCGGSSRSLSERRLLRMYGDTNRALISACMELKAEREMRTGITMGDLPEIIKAFLAEAVKENALDG